MLKIILGMAAGGIGGYLWHRIVGCASGACPIARNPYMSAIAGAFLGLLIMLSR